MTDRPRPEQGALDDPTRDIRFSSPPDLRPPMLPAPGSALPQPGSGVHDQTTDQLPRPGAAPRERTLAFSHPEMSRRPVGSVQVGRSPRRWPWVVLTVLPVLVILGAALAWYLLIRSA